MAALLVLAQVSSDPEVAKGEAQISQGAFEAAARTLEAARLRLDGSGAAEAELYLGYAYLRAGRKEQAKDAMRSALRHQKDVRAPDLPKDVATLLESVRGEGQGHTGRVAIVTGVVAAAGITAAVVAGSKGGTTGATTSQTFTGTLQGASSSQTFTLQVGGSGILTATLSWLEAGIVFAMSLQDSNGNTLAVSNTTTVESASLISNVSQATPGPNYTIVVTRIDSLVAPGIFTLVVQHP